MRLSEVVFDFNETFGELMLIGEHLHLRLPRGDQPAGKAQAGRPRLYRAL